MIKRRTVFEYVAALALVGAALGAKIGIQRLTDIDTRFLIPLICGTFVAWRMRVGPAAAMVGLYTLVHVTFIMQPAGSVLPRSANDWLQVTLFLTAMCFVIGAVSSAKNSRVRSDAAHEIASSVRAEAATARGRLLAALDLSHEPVALLMPLWNKAKGIDDFRLDYINTAGAAVHRGEGDAQATLGRQLLQLFPQLRDSELFRCYVTVMTTGEPATVRLLDPAPGEDRWLELRASRADDALIAQWRDVTEEKRVTDEVRLKEQRYRTVVEATSAIVWTIGTDGSILDGRENWAAFTGQPLDETAGVGWMDAIHPEDRQRVSGQWRHAIATRSHYHVEQRIQRYDGEYRIMSLRMVPMLDASGETREWIGVCTDVTGFRTAERSSRNAERQTRRVLNSLFAFVSVCSPDGVLLEVNTPPLRAAGILAQEVKGKKLWDTYWWSYSATAQMLLRQALERAASGEPSRYDVQVRLAGGTLRWIDFMITPLYDENANITHLIGSAVDVSDRKRVEQALQASEAELRVIFESASVGISQIDALTGRVTRFNDAFCEMTGQSRERLSRMTIGDLCHPDRDVGALPDLAPLQHGLMDQLVSELCFTHEGDDQTFLQMSASLLRDEDREPSQITVVLLDVTDRKYAEMQVQKSEEDLRQLNATLEARVRDRTAVARQRAEQLRALTLDLTEAESRERRRLAQLLHDQFQQLVSAAKLKAGLVRGKIESEPMVAMMRQIEDLLDQAIQASRSLVTELSPPLLHDAGLVAALNWLSRRMEKDHSLLVHVEAQEGVEPEGEQIRTILFECARELLFNITKHAGTNEAWVELAQSENLLKLSVRDEGKGFDPQEVWEAQHVKGSFGLFSLRERLSLIGGVATVISSPGSGANIEIVLPMVTASAQSPAIPSAARHHTAPSEGDRPKTRVIVADDHGLFREGLISLISQEPYVELVGEACDGDEALKLARQLQPDVLIVDVSMPGRNGIQVASVVARELPHTRVIGLSMHEREDMAAAMRDAGAYAYCTKSGPSDVLLGALRHAAGAPAAQN